MVGGTSGGLRRKEHVKHRIACSVLVALGAISLSQSAAFGSSPAVIAPDAGVFGQIAGTTLVADVSLALAVSGCPDGKACFWKQQDFNGDRKSADGGDAGEDFYLGGYDRSMKNRLSNRRVVIKDVDYDTVDCINPGGERSNLSARADIFKIGSSGSSC